MPIGYMQMLCLLYKRLEGLAWSQAPQETEEQLCVMFIHVSGLQWEISRVTYQRALSGVPQLLASVSFAQT